MTLHDGYFHHDGERFIPFGANYWPRSTGPAMWELWPKDEIARDLDAMASLGMNAIRFLLRWEDFQPSPLAVDPAALDRLDAMLAMCRDRGLWANPSLFVGWMSGRAYFPAWKGSRSMFQEPEVVEACRRLVLAAGERIARHSNVFAVDLGNELNVLADSVATPPSQIARWCGAMTSALREAGVHAPLLSGCDHGQVYRDSGWRLDNQDGCDLFSVHGYPVPAWVPVPFAGRLDPFGQALYPFALSVARAYGPAFLQEFGTLGALSPVEQRQYLQALLPATWGAGANGYLWWCLRDFDEEKHPYTSFPFEAGLGLIDANGRVHDGLEPYVEFGQALSRRPIPEPGSIHVYQPATPYRKEVEAEPGNSTEALSSRMLAAWHALTRLGHKPQVVREPGQDKVLVVSGARLGVAEVRRLTEWVREGGRMLYFGVPWATWGPSQAELLGALLADLRSAAPLRCDFGHGGEVEHWIDDTIVQAQPVLARVLARDGEGRPVVFLNQLGRGRIVWSTASPEEAIVRLGARPEVRDPWIAWFRAGLEALG